MNKSVEKISIAFLELLEKKPFNKITVRDIVQKSNVHRNTFYYHFQDIPSLLEYLIREIIDSIEVDPSSEASLVEGIRPVLAYMLENKKTVMNLYNSLGKENLIKGLRAICARVVNKVLLGRRGDKEVAPRDMELMCRFQTAMMTGVLIDWLENQMSYDLTGDIARAVTLFEEGIAEDIARGNRP